MSHRRSTVKGSLSFANPTVRAWLFQILAVVAVVGIVGWLFHNTVTNLNNRGIMNRPGFPGECFICELRLPDHRF